MDKLATTTFMVVLLVAVVVVAPSVPSAHDARTLEDVKLPVVVAATSSPTTTCVTFDEVVDGPAVPGPDTADYDDKTPLLGPV